MIENEVLLNIGKINQTYCQNKVLVCLEVPTTVTTVTTITTVTTVTTVTTFTTMIVKFQMSLL